MLVRPDAMDPDSKIWIFQSKDTLNTEIQASISNELIKFLDEWAAHNVQLHTSGAIHHDRFITIMVDERHTGASGCSLDNMHQFIHHLENKYNLNLMDRMQVAYYNEGDNHISEAELNTLPELISQGIINEETFVFDNLVPTKSDFDNRWKVQIKNSWHKRFIK